MDAKHKRKLVLGRKVRYLNNCIKALELLEKFETPESVRKRIFFKHIKSKVGGISYAQFNNMLNEPNPAKQLAEIEIELQTL